MMSLSEWRIDGDIGIDAAGNLYATWDTQGTNPDGSANDIGWLSFYPHFAEGRRQGPGPRRNVVNRFSRFG
jgi:hypothetical protein